MQDRPILRSTSIRITDSDDKAIEEIIQAGWARSRSAAISYALRLAIEELRRKQVVA